MNKYTDVVEIPYVDDSFKEAIVAVRLENFDTGKAVPRDGHMKWIKEVAAEIVLKIPNSWVYIIGYATKLGSPQANLELSKKRAEEVKLELGLQVSMRGGIFGDRVTKEYGYGEDHPLYIADKDKDDNPRWRAVEVAIFGFKPEIVRRPVHKSRIIHREFSYSEHENNFSGSGKPDPTKDAWKDLVKLGIKLVQNSGSVEKLIMGDELIRQRRTNNFPSNYQVNRVYIDRKVRQELKYTVQSTFIHTIIDYIWEFPANPFIIVERKHQVTSFGEVSTFPTTKEMVFRQHLAKSSILIPPNP